MRCLVVEDDPEFADEIGSILTAAKASHTRRAESRDAARTLIDQEFFDFLILDLRIPTTAGSLDADPLHGLAVFTHARQVAPGMPILVLTASSAEDFIPTLLREAQQIDVWERGQSIRTVQFLKKIDLTELPNLLAPICAQVNALGDIEIQASFTLPLTHDRLVRMFVRRCSGARCEMTELGGGLSGSRVLRLLATDSSGGIVHDAVVKLGSISTITDEASRFDGEISRLASAATPRMLAVLKHGAKGDGGVFYQLVQQMDGTAFEASQWQSGGENVAQSLEAMTGGWSRNFPQSSKTVAEIRRRVLSDEQLHEILRTHDLPWVPAFEEGRAQTFWCCVHGDMHGENVLAAHVGHAVLIDYGDVGDGPRSLDPLTLEFSLLFHPASPFVNGAWPSESQANAWSDLEPYLVGCPVPDFVRAMRAWTVRAAAGKREIAATAYAYLMRQLKYEATNVGRVTAMLAGARALYAST